MNYNYNTLNLFILQYVILLYYIILYYSLRLFYYSFKIYLTVAMVRLNWRGSLFREEISACAPVHMGYDVMDTWDCMGPTILFPLMMGMLFLLFVLKRLIISESKHWITWSYRTGINFPFWGGKESNTLVFLLNHIFLTHFYFCVNFVCFYIFWGN